MPHNQLWNPIGIDQIIHHKWEAHLVYTSGSLFEVERLSAKWTPIFVMGKMDSKDIYVIFERTSGQLMLACPISDIFFKGGKTRN